jgi:hypothetical protein
MLDLRELIRALAIFSPLVQVLWRPVDRSIGVPALFSNHCKYMSSDASAMLGAGH